MTILNHRYTTMSSFVKPYVETECNYMASSLMCCQMTVWCIKAAQHVYMYVLVMKLDKTPVIVGKTQKHT